MMTQVFPVAATLVVVGTAVPIIGPRAICQVAPVDETPPSLSISAPAVLSTSDPLGGLPSVGLPQVSASISVGVNIPSLSLPGVGGVLSSLGVGGVLSSLGVPGGAIPTPSVPGGVLSSLSIPGGAIASPSVPGAGSLPSLSVPSISIPAVNLPSQSAASLGLPSNNPPIISASLSIGLNDPSLSLPPVVIPSPSIDPVGGLSSLSIPPVVAPSLSAPSLGLPSLNPPVVSASLSVGVDGPSISLPPLASASLSVPSIALPSPSVPGGGLSSPSVPVVGQPSPSVPVVGLPGGSPSSSVAASSALPSSSSAPQSRLATFEGASGLPVLALSPIGSYLDVNWGGFALGKTGGLQSAVLVKPNTPDNLAAFGGTLGGTGSMTPGTNIDHFDLNSFYYGCALSTAVSVLGVPTTCTISVKGYADAAGTQLVASQDYCYTVSLLNLSTQMVKATLDASFKNLKKVTYSVTNGLTTAGLIDTVSYNVYSK